MFLYFIYSFIFSKTLSGEYWTKANLFSQATLFFRQPARTLESNFSVRFMQACINWNPIRRKRKIMLQSKLFFFCSRFLYVTPPLKRVAFFWQELFVLLEWFSYWVSRELAISSSKDVPQLTLLSFIWIIMCILFALGFSWIPKEGLSERFNFHNWKSEKIPVLYQLCSLRIRKTQLLITTHKMLKNARGFAKMFWRW